MATRPLTDAEMISLEGRGRARALTDADIEQMEALGLAQAPTPESEQGGVGTFLKDLAIEAAPSTIGGFLGARLGMLGGPFAPVTVPAGEAIGSGLGEIVNQLRRQSQGEDFSWAQVGAATAGGPILRSLGWLGRTGVRGFARILPGSTEVVQKEFIQPRVAAKVASLRPQPGSEELFQKAEQFGQVRVPATETVKTIRKMRGEARRASEVNKTEIDRMTQTLRDFADIKPGQDPTPPIPVGQKGITKLRTAERSALLTRDEIKEILKSTGMPKGELRQAMKMSADELEAKVQSLQKAGTGPFQDVYEMLAERRAQQVQEAGEAFRGPTGEPVTLPGQPLKLPRPGEFHNQPTLSKFRAKQKEVFGPATRHETGPAQGRAKVIYEAMAKDLEKSGIPHIREAVRAFKRELGVEEIEGLIKTHTSPMNRVGLFGGINESGVREFERINGAQVAKQISRHRDKFERYFSPSEVDELIKFFRKQTTGTGLLQNVGARFASVGVGAAVGGPFGAAVGTFAPEIVFSMITSEPGRAVLKRLLREGPITGPKLARALHDAGLAGFQIGRAGASLPGTQAPGPTRRPEPAGPRAGSRGGPGGTGGRYRELEEFLNGQR